MRPELLNKNLDGYQIRRQLGSGGFADAFLATTPQNRQVALKILKPELALNFDIVREFATEAVYLSRLPHKHIVPFEKFGVAGQDYYIAMAYAPQGSLKELLQGNTLLTEKTAVDVITQTAEAVQYAHDNKILHRDIKPANLLLKNLYDVWVTDFGIAITAHHPDSLSRQQIAASLSYAAPEQLIGQAIRESDVYSLAVTTYELLSRKLPYTPPYGKDFREIYEKLLQTPAKALSEQFQVKSRLIDELGEVVTRGMEKDYTRRIGSVDEYSKKLNEAVKKAENIIIEPPIVGPWGQGPAGPIWGPRGKPGTPPQAPGPLGIPTTPPSPIPPAAPVPPVQPSPWGNPVSPNPWDQWGGITQPINPPPPQNPPGPNRQPSQHTSRLSRRQVLGGIVGLAAAGGILGLLTQKDRLASIPEQLQSTLSETSAGKTLETYRRHEIISGKGVISVTWSPDGKYIASAGYDDPTAQVWEALTGRRISMYTADNGPVASVQWSPDGKYIASYAGDRILQVWVPTTGVRNNYLTDATNLFTWSPDSNYLAFGREGVIYLRNATTGYEKISFNTEHIYDIPTAISWSPDGKYIALGSRYYLPNNQEACTVQIYDAATGQSINTYKGHSGSIDSISWSPDSKHIASTSNDNTVQVWDAFTSQFITEHQIVSNSFADIAPSSWSPDGKYIATAGNENTIDVWDAESGKDVLVYSGHSAFINSLAWSPDSKKIASGSDDGTVQVWQAE